MEPVIRIEKLEKSFGSLKVLKGIDLEVMPGEVVCIIGASGSGKSTLLRCINLLEYADSGHIWFDGNDLMDLGTDLNALRQRIGMVFQSYDLFPHMTVLENILLSPTVVQKRPRDEVKAEAMALLERVGLAEKAEQYPRQLSGGQKQRVAIVRALCVHPEVLLFDEVTAALDPEMVREVLEVILDLSDQGRTMLIVTHEMQFARAVADRVLFLENGRFLEDSPPEVFFDAPRTERARRYLQTFSFERKRNHTKNENEHSERSTS